MLILGTDVAAELRVPSSRTSLAKDQGGSSRADTSVPMTAWVVISGLQDRTLPSAA